MKHGAGGPKHSEEVSANQLLLRALAGQSPGAITPASSESLSRREEEEEEEEEKEGERKPRATPKEEREVAAGSGHCRDGPALNPACGPAISERQALSAGREQRRIPTNFGRRDPGGVCSASPTSCPGQQIERDLYKSILITKQNKTKQNKTKNTLVSSHLKYRYITQTASKIFL
ncbi:uncharacterized protein LOC134148452 isoform X11 [Rhea pennata]|uniref:uncharacterized protein LOC134148452 isoform X11 n=1 Tax=Rhea pennata TaxID=8795 RepID=UPI002E273876